MDCGKQNSRKMFIFEQLRTPFVVSTRAQPPLEKVFPSQKSAGGGGGGGGGGDGGSGTCNVQVVKIDSSLVSGFTLAHQQISNG